jgi:hypothetical protein
LTTLLVEKADMHAPKSFIVANSCDKTPAS